jgi:hypothetical protein
MKDAITLLILLAAPALADGPPPPSWEIEQIYNLATLSRSEAFHLNGQRAKFRIKLIDDYEPIAGQYVYPCADDGDIERTAWFGDELELEWNQTELIVEARLRLVHRPPWVAPDGMKFEAYTECSKTPGGASEQYWYSS